MIAASFGHGWSALSRAISHSARRSVSATLALHQPPRFSPPKTINFVGNTTPAPNDPLIFEDKSEDYASVGNIVTPQAISTLDLIESCLPSQLPQPAVSDASIFEEVSSDEYAIPNLSNHPPPSSMFQVLESLIINDQDEEAYEFLMEIQNSGFEIPTSMMYAHAALRVISSPNLSEEAILSRLSLWLKNVPPAYVNAPWRELQSLKRHIFGSLRPTITLAVEFSLIMASKGYAKLIALDAVPFIARFAHISITTRFLKDFAEADLSYLINSDRQLQGASALALEERISLRKQEMADIIQGPAITTLTKWGDYKSALSLLPPPDDPIKISSGIYQFLLSRLRTLPSHIDMYLKDIERIEGVLKYSILPTQPTTIFTRRDKSDLRVLQGEMLLIGERMAAQLQRLIDRISQSQLSADELIPFFSAYLALDRTIAIIRLRKLARRRNKLTFGTFLYGEMSFYLRNGHHLLLLRSFVNHFRVADLPHKFIQRSIKSLEADVHTDGRSVYDPEFLDQTVNVTEKLWPTRGHSDLLWLSLLRSIPDDETAARLYRGFIDYQKRIRKPEAHATVLHLSPREEFPVGTPVFTEFMSRLLYPNSPNSAAEIMRNMAEIGVPTTIHHLTLLSTFYANADEPQRALMIVNAMEEAHPAIAPKPMEGFLSHPKGVRPPTDLPMPDVVFYASVMNAFVKTEALQEANIIRRRFLQRFEYRFGVHSFIDACLHNLAALKQKAATQSTLRISKE